MVQVIKTIYQLKRGKADRWIELNPILKDGEPGFEIDTGRLKIGNGILPWVELPYVNSDLMVQEDEIISVYNRAELPKEGNSMKIYRVISEKRLYQWDDLNSEYQSLGGTSEEFSIIDCGSATRNI